MNPDSKSPEKQEGASVEFVDADEVLEMFDLSRFKSYHENSIDFIGERLEKTAEILARNIPKEQIQKIKFRLIEIGSPAGLAPEVQGSSLEAAIFVNPFASSSGEIIARSIIALIPEALKRAEQVTSREELLRAFSNWRERKDFHGYLILGDLTSPENFTERQEVFDKIVQLLQTAGEKLDKEGVANFLWTEIKFVDSGGSRSGRGTILIIDVTEDIETIKKFIREHATLRPHDKLLEDL